MQHTIGARCQPGVDSYGRDRVTGRWLTALQADNIGRLLRDIGYAVQMDYNPAFAGGRVLMSTMPQPFSHVTSAIRAA